MGSGICKAVDEFRQLRHASLYGDFEARRLRVNVSKFQHAPDLDLPIRAILIEILLVETLVIGAFLSGVLLSGVLIDGLSICG
jgi:hypothetical protein